MFILDYYRIRDLHFTQNYFSVVTLVCKNASHLHYMKSPHSIVTKTVNKKKSPRGHILSVLTEKLDRSLSCIEWQLFATSPLKRSSVCNSSVVTVKREFLKGNFDFSAFVTSKRIKLFQLCLLIKKQVLKCVSDFTDCRYRKSLDELQKSTDKKVALLTNATKKAEVVVRTCHYCRYILYI